MNYEKYARKKRQKELNSFSKKSINKVGILILKILAISVIAIGVLGFSFGLGLVKSIIDGAPKVDFETEEVNPDKYATFIYNQQNIVVQKLHGTDANRIYVELDLIPKHMQDAVVATEDERFWEHNGIDIQGMIRAVVKNIQTKDPTGSGASTITQQILKNNILSPAKTFERKIQEQYLALQMEEVRSKEEILELYLNTAPFGQGTLGVQAAANLYFNKDISEITIAESAVIAAITQLPTKYNPISNPEHNRDKQLVILKKMYEQEYITEKEYKEAINEKVYDNIQVVAKTIEQQSDYSYFVDEVIKQVAKDLTIQKAYSETEAYNLIYTGGLKIYITQDMEMQAIADKVFQDDSYFPPEGTYESFDIKIMYSLSVKDKDGTHNHYAEELLPTLEEAKQRVEALKAEWLAAGGEFLGDKALYIPQPQGAMAIMDYKTGHVKVLVGGRGQKEGNRTFNRATEAQRQPGSCFKPLAAYLPAIDTAGYTLATVIDDVPFEVINSSGAWAPKNWYSNPYNYWGLSTVREAIQWSMNICAVKTLYDVGINTSWDYLMDLGFTTLIDSEEVNGQIVTDKGLALTLGGLTYGVTPLELTAAYGAIANGGVYTKPILYTKVVDHSGAIILSNEQPKTHTVMKDTTAYLLTSAMQSVVTAGTGYNANFSGMPVSGKTGTTSDDVDLLFAGFTPYYVGAIWMGYDQPQRMRYSTDYHNKMWSAIMEEIHKDLPYKDFEKPNGITGATVCKASGKLAVPGLCDQDPRHDQVYYEIFATGTVPTESCDVHVKAKICTVSQLFASEFCPQETVEERVYIKRLEPLIPENWDPADPPRIRDYQYELPTTMEGEICNIHTEEGTLIDPTETPINPADPNAPETETPSGEDETFTGQ